MVPELVKDGAADLVGQLVGIGEVSFKGQAEERDLVGEGHRARALLHARDALVEPVQPAVVGGAAELRLLGHRQLLDDDRDVVEEPPEVRWQRAEDALHEHLERNVAPFGRYASGEQGVGEPARLGAEGASHRSMARDGVSRAPMPRQVSRADGQPRRATRPMVVRLQGGERIALPRLAGADRDLRGRSSSCTA